jgi:hypothetical protein
MKVSRRKAGRKETLMVERGRKKDVKIKRRK